METTDTNMPEQLMSGKIGASASDEPTVIKSASPIAKRIKNDPCTRHLSILQTSLYVDPMTKVYRSRERVRSLVCPQQEKLPLSQVEADQVERTMFRLALYECRYCWGMFCV